MIEIPKTITAGDSFAVEIETQSINGRAFSPADYDLKVIFRGIGSALDIECTSKLSTWSLSVSPSESAELKAGSVKWVAILTKGDSERITLCTGIMEVNKDLSDETTYDPRTPEQIELEALKKALGTFTDSGGKVQKYTIGNRQMEFATIAELRTELFRVQRIVANQLGISSDKFVRFTNAV